MLKDPIVTFISNYLPVFDLTLHLLHIVILFDVQQMLNQTLANNYHKSIYIEVHVPMSWGCF